MNHALQAAALAAHLDDPAHAELRLCFGLACAQRVAHLLEDPGATDALGVLGAFLDGRCPAAQLDDARTRVEAIARSHPGSRSLDGASHAAVSATHAVAHALAGRALQAADYAAYAVVYAYGGYAVAEPAAFEQEFAWQLREFLRLATMAEAKRAQAQPPHR